MAQLVAPLVSIHVVGLPDPYRLWEHEQKNIVKKWMVSHRKEVYSITGIFTREEKTRAASICNKSAITDHVCNENHVIDWENAKVIDRESDKAGRLIREAIWIRQTDNMNRDEGSYQLSHIWDKLLHSDDRHRKSVLMKASDMKLKRQ